jgi:hypothetical protein
MLAVLAAAGPTHAQTLYDASLGSLPGDQGYLAYLPPLGTGGGSETLVSNPGPGIPAHVRMQTLPENSNRGGYFSHVAFPPFIPLSPVNIAWPVLNSGSGYTVRFDVRLQSEVHATNNRAGFSVITIDSQGKGIELSFWLGSIWAQEGGQAPLLFTQAEGAGVDTVGAFARYELSVHQNRYVLFRDGRFVLVGALRDYSAFDAASSGLPFNPYTTRSFLFLGDNTNSASATTLLSRVQITQGPAPYPLGCQPADIADDAGNPLPSNQPNGGLNEGDYNAFFAAQGFFDQASLGPQAIGGTCDIACDSGEPLPAFPATCTNNGVNEGDFNCFFNFLFLPCP